MKQPGWLNGKVTKLNWFPTFFFCFQKKKTHGPKFATASASLPQRRETNRDPCTLRSRRVKGIEAGGNLEDFNFFTLPKFNSSPLKSYLPNRKIVFQPSFFSGYVKLPGCTLPGFPTVQQHLFKMNGWKMTGTYWGPGLRPFSEVSFRECKKESTCDVVDCSQTIGMFWYDKYLH